MDLLEREQCQLHLLARHELAEPEPRARRALHADHDHVVIHVSSFRKDESPSRHRTEALSCGAKAESVCVTEHGSRINNPIRVV
jgi:hypothetical protein